MATRTTTDLTLATIGNHDWLPGLSAVAAHLLDVSNHIHTLADLTKNDVLSIEPRSQCCCDKELTAVGVGATVGHREKTNLGVLSLEVLVSEFLAVDGSSASTILSGEVAALAHESWDDSVEGRSFVAKALLSGAQGAEILDSLWHIGVVHVEDDSTGWSTANGHVKKATHHFC